MIIRPPLVYDNYNIKSINNSMGYRRWMHATDFRREYCDNKINAGFGFVALDELRKFYNNRISKNYTDVDWDVSSLHTFVSLKELLKSGPVCDWSLGELRREFPLWVEYL